MLPFRLELGRPSASICLDAVVDRQFGVYVMRFDGLTFDNRFLPTSWQPDPRWHLAVLVTDGAFTIGDERFEEGEGFAADTATLAPRANGPAFVRSSGRTAAFVALRLRPPFFQEPYRQPLVRMPANVRELPWRDLHAERLASSFDVVLDGLRDAGVLDQSTPTPLAPSTGPGRVVSRIASTVFPTLSRLATRPTMVDLMARAQLTERQLLRNLVRVQEDFEFLDRGWRSAILRWRVTTGALLLSAPEISLVEAAQLAGYSSLKAMARAFSDADLPSPSEVRERIGKNAV